MARSQYLGGETLIELKPMKEQNGADPFRLILPGHDVRPVGETVHVTLEDGWVLPEGGH